jgi:ATP-dependent Lon protease
LDPEQNGTFQDHYLDLPFDLSQVTFLATANDRDAIPGPLLDRMEVIEVPGYTRAEKLGIATQFLIPKQLRAHGLTEDRLEFLPDAIATILDSYTREAGVRSLEREVASMCRAVAVRLAEGEDVHIKADRDFVEKTLGPTKYRPEVAERRLEPGVATGLSTSAGGGDILFIEASKMRGRGQLTITGNLRSVMQESATTAVSYVRSKAVELSLDPEWLREIDLHVHVPKAGTPKDGPSAGITIFLAVLSLLLDCPVRNDVAMTGEISLRGRVLPVGGIKQKLFGAHRAGMREVLIPARNKRDLDDVPPEILAALKVTLVSTVEEVIRAALLPPRPPASDADEAQEDAASVVTASG